MREIQASEAKVHLPQLLDDVERGETLIITRHGRRIARIVPEVDRRQEEIDKALAGIMSFGCAPAGSRWGNCCQPGMRGASSANCSNCWPYCPIRVHVVGGRSRQSRLRASPTPPALGPDRLPCCGSKLRYSRNSKRLPFLPLDAGLPQDAHQQAATYILRVGIRDPELSSASLHVLVIAAGHRRLEAQ